MIETAWFLMVIACQHPKKPAIVDCRVRQVAIAPFQSKDECEKTVAAAYNLKSFYCEEKGLER